VRIRRILIALAAVNAVLLAALGFTLMRAGANEWNGTLIDPPMTEQPFELLSADGPVTSRDLHGRWTLLFFGYTRCPDACPLTLQKLHRVHEALGDRAKDVQVTLVTVDPTHDTPEILADYVGRFDSSFLGLSADAPAIEALAKTYGVHHAEKARAAAPDEHAGHTPPANALIDHTTHVFVLDREGRLAMLWGPELTAEQMTSDLRRLLRR